MIQIVPDALLQTRSKTHFWLKEAGFGRKMTGRWSDTAAWVASLVCFVAAFVNALALRRASGGGRSLPGCGPGTACDLVTASRWSRLGNMPVATLGMIAYAIAAAAVIVSFEAPESFRKAGVELSVIAAATLLAAGIWFIFVQAVLIHRYCMFCCVTHLLAGCGASLVFVAALTRLQTEFWMCIAVASIFVTFLIVVQLLMQAREFAYERSSSDGVALQQESTSPDDHSANSLSTTRVSRRAVSLLNGKVRTDASLWPTLGSPEADDLIIWFHDFTCAECHRMHGFIRTAVDHYAGRLAVLAIPVPLHPACNPDIKCYQPDQISACKFAELGLDIWWRDSRLYEQWDRFLASADESVPFGVAAIKAREMVNMDEGTACPTPAFEEQVRDALMLYRAAKSPKLPSLVLPKGLITGRFAAAEDLIALLDKYVILPVGGRMGPA